MLYKLRNVKKEFGPRTVLDIDRLDFQAGRIYALIGPNGAGKTTLLNQLAFLDQPTSGTVSFMDQGVKYERNGLTRLRRKVVLVDQSPILFSGSVWRNVEFGLKVRGVAKNERDARIGRALEQVGMLEFGRSDVHGLSGGEVKRVALARGLAVEPEVLLCDEPTANVDRQHQEIILKIIGEANRLRNTTIIFSTHYLSQSRRLAHETILLQNGRLSVNMEENVFSGLFRDTGPGEMHFELGEGCQVGVGSTEPPAQPGETGQVHLIPDALQIVPVAAAASDTTRLGGTVQSVSADAGTIRVMVDIGVLLTVRVEKERFVRNPVQVCQQVEVIIPEEAIVRVS